MSRRGSPAAKPLLLLTPMLSSLSEERRDPDDNKMARPSQSRCGCAFGRRKLTLSATPLGKDHLWGVRAPSSNEVQVPLSRAGDDPSSLAVELDEAGLLELLADVTDNAAANLAKVLRPHALPVRGSVNLSELSDTDSLLEVDLPGDARGAHVVPVWVVGTQLLVAPGLDEVNVLAWSKLQRERERERNEFIFLSDKRSFRSRGLRSRHGRADARGLGARARAQGDRNAPIDAPATARGNTALALSVHPLPVPDPSS